MTIASLRKFSAGASMQHPECAMPPGRFTHTIPPIAPIFRQISVPTNSAYRREVARSISTATMSPAALLYS